VKPLGAVYRFLYGLIIGDDWKITAGIVASLLLGSALLASNVAAPLVAIVTGALVVVAFATSLLIDVRRR
jgi:hypothetical protein